MKTTYLLFLTIVWAAWMQGTGYAAEHTAEKRPDADNHLGAQRATPPESGGELLKMLPSSDEEGWRAERRGGAEQAVALIMTVPARFSTALSTPPFRHANFADAASGHPGDAEHAAPADDGKHQPAAKPTDEPRDPGRASNPNRPPSRPSLTKANRPKPLANGRQRSVPGNVLHQRGSNKSGGAASRGLIRNETLRNAVPVRTSSVAQTTGPSRNNVRHRGSNPAAVTGSVNSNRRNTGAIDGTRMSRKH
jgi:hypothetical protein